MNQLFTKLFVRWMPNRLLAVMMFIAPTALLADLVLPDPLPVLDEATFAAWSILLWREAARRAKSRLEREGRVDEIRTLEVEPETDTLGYGGPERRRVERVQVRTRVTTPVWPLPVARPTPLPDFEGEAEDDVYN